jgi:MGT family glycosyltransferase
MSRILIFGVAGHGHVNPTLPVIAELTERGHRITYYNSEELRAKIAHAGVEFRPYPEPSPTVADIGALAANLARVTRFLFGESIRLLPFILDELEREKPDLVIFDSIALWGMQAAHLLGLPSVASITTFVQKGVSGIITWRDMLYMMGYALPNMPAILRQRRQLVKSYGPGVFPHKAIFPCVGDTNIVYTSRAFQPDTPFIDESFHFVGPSIAPASRQQADFPWELLEEGRSHIYVSLGTVHNTNVDFYHTAFTAFADHPAQFILSAGQATDIHSLGPIPENFIIRPAVPQLELLQKVDLFITHGGMNSVNEGLYYGVPLVVLPHQMEQMLNGRQVAHKRAGILLGDRPPYGQVDAATLRKSVEKIMAGESYRQNAVQIGQSFREAGGYQEAVNVITRVLDRG